MKTLPNTVLILGANGRLGNAAVDAFFRAGWSVRAQARRAGSWPTGVQTVVCDGMDTHALARAAEGAGVIVHALNPSRYTVDAWRREARQMLACTIAAARSSGALLMLPGNVYNFGRGMPACLSECSPDAADTPLGLIRLEMEAALRDASDVDSVVLRAGDFFGGGSGVWFDWIIVRDLARGVVRYPGPLDRLHAWNYLPDLAETFVRVATRRCELHGFQRFHVPGHTLTGAQLVAALERATGRTLKVRAMPWAALVLALPFSPMLRSLWTMRYLWRRPHSLDGRALTALLGNVPHTELDAALGRALAQLNPPLPHTPLTSHAA